MREQKIEETDTELFQIQSRIEWILTLSIPSDVYEELKDISQHINSVRINLKTGDTEMKKENKHEAYLSYAQDNYYSRINADNLLALEKALMLHLEEVQKTLSSAWSATDKRTVREVYNDEAINTTAD